MIFPTDKSRSVFVAIKSVAGEVYEEALSGLTGEQRRMLIDGLEPDRRKPFRRRNAVRRTSESQRNSVMNAVAKVDQEGAEAAPAPLPVAPAPVRCRSRRSRLAGGGRCACS